MLKRIRLIFQYIRDKEVSLFKKLLIIGSLLYLIFPVDIVPDFIVGLGILDDITVLSFIWFALKSELDDYGNRKGIQTGSKAKVIPLDNRRKGE